jgi:hypothetical protein
MLVTALVSNKGTVINELQLWNIPVILTVPPEVLRGNRGTDFKEVQPMNILDRFVAAERLNAGTVSSEKQLANMLVVEVALEVSYNGTDCSEEHPLNIDWKL